MTTKSLLNENKEQLNDLFDFIQIKNLEFDTVEKMQNVLDLFIKSKSEFYSKMINKNNTTTNLFNNIANKMFNDYISKK